MIVKQILLAGLLENVLRQVWRICILMLGCEGVNHLTVFLSFDVVEYFMRRKK